MILLKRRDRIRNYGSEMLKKPRGKRSVISFDNFDWDIVYNNSFIFRALPDFPPVRSHCVHKKSTLKCSTLSALDVYSFHKMFCKNKDKRTQDAFLLKHMTVSHVQRHRPRKNVSNHQTESSCSTKYFVRNELKELVPVCVEAFIKILHVSRHHLNTFAKKFFENSDISDKRGGYPQSLKLRYTEQKEDVTNFINSLEFKESHYCRSSTERKYLTSDLNITKLYKVYEEWSQLKGIKSTVFPFHLQHEVQHFVRISSFRCLLDLSYFCGKN